MILILSKNIVELKIIMLFGLLEGKLYIYKQFLDAELIDRCSVTFINKYFKCDTFFPKFGKEWLAGYKEVNIIRLNQ